MKTKSLPAGVYRRESGGKEYFLVSLGRDTDGKQRWKSCKSEDEARTERALFLKAQANEGESLWHLTPQDRADAAAGLEILRAYPGETLVAAATFYQRHHLALIRTQNIAELVQKFLDEHAANCERHATAVDARYRLKKLVDAFGDKLAGEVSVEDTKNFSAEMKRAGLGNDTRKNVLNTACSWYRWAIANGYANKNPFDPAATPRPKVRRGEVRFFSVAQSAKILADFRQHGLGVYAALGLFCGIRPDERKRLVKKHFSTDGNTLVIRLGADVTKTTRRRVLEFKRGTPLGDCVWAWLAPAGRLEIPNNIVPSEWQFRQAFGAGRENLDFDWIDDGLRHTAPTHYYALTRDESAVTALLGHGSPLMFRTHYKGLATESEARQFFALRP